MISISRIRSGEEKLWKIFWIGLLIPQLLGIVAGVFIGAQVASQGGSPDAAAAAVTKGPELVAVLLVYYLLLLAAVWNNKENTKYQVLGYLAFAVILLFTISMAG